MTVTVVELVVEELHGVVVDDWSLSFSSSGATELPTASGEVPPGEKPAGVGVGLQAGSEQLWLTDHVGVPNALELPAVVATEDQVQVVLDDAKADEREVQTEGVGAPEERGMQQDVKLGSVWLTVSH